MFEVLDYYAYCYGCFSQFPISPLKLDGTVFRVSCQFRCSETIVRATTPDK